MSRRGRPESDFTPKREKVLNTSPDLLSVVPRFRDRPEAIQQFWKAAKWVKDNERSKVLFVKGPKGSGRKDIIRQFVRNLSNAGVMDSMILSYHENGAIDDGYRGAVQHVLSPWGENENFVIAPATMVGERKASSHSFHRTRGYRLAKWCGFWRRMNKP